MQIVLVDDEIKLLNALKRALELEKFETKIFSNPLEALTFIKNHAVDLVISDIRMKEMNGIELLEKVQNINPQIPFILMTAYSSIETAVMAIRLGASDYLLKPFEIEEFLLSVKRVLSIKNDFRSQNYKFSDVEPFPQVIGTSKAMQEILQKVDAVADSESSVLIWGESGTGKELIAKLIHIKSKRSKNKFVAINCSAIPENLFEYKLFGPTSKGGTHNTEESLFSEANDGTVFLDEVTDISLANQVKLLNFLHHNEYHKLHNCGSKCYNVRIISASNKNISEEISKGLFREDLYYKLSTFCIYLPPLRARFEDLPELVHYLVDKFSKYHKKGPFIIEDNFIQSLKNYSWPGNIRELENFIERLIIIKREGILTSEDAINNFRSCDISSSNNNFNTILDKLNLHLDQSLSLDSMLEKIESEIIYNALLKTNWNYSKAARILGVTRQNLHYKLKKYKFIKD